MDEKREIDRIRAQQTGRMPAILVEADTLSEAYHKAVIACYERGCRVETPKHTKGGTLGFDAHITVNVNYPDKEPVMHSAGLVEDARGIIQYVLEVTHGIHNHWKKDPNDPNDLRWGYTYNERFASQIPFALAKVKRDFEKKGRISGRDYFFGIWRPAQDAILEQDDPPCLQFGQMRFIQDNKGVYNLNYNTAWRSRDENKAWLENNIAQIELMKLLAMKTSSMLGVPINIGAYKDTSTSLHLYGLYFDRDNLQDTIERMRRGTAASFAMSLEDYLGGKEDIIKLKRLVAAQGDAEKKGRGTNIGEGQLRELGYDLETFAYPNDWDTWPKAWDEEPDKSLLRE